MLGAGSVGHLTQVNTVAYPTTDHDAMNHDAVPPRRGRQPRRTDTGAPPLTIGQLARMSDVGVETIRYYQRRGLLPVPPSGGAVRLYPTALVQRIRFIKKAQSVGFTLEEIGTLLDLADGRNRRRVQAVTAARLAQINGKLADLARMQAALAHLLHQCLTTGEVHPCPIIEALAEGEDASQV